MNERFKIRVGVYAILEKDGKLLFSQYADGIFKGEYNFPAGHVDGNETLKEAMCRELKEELGIDVKESDLLHLHTSHRNGTVEYIDVYFKVTKWEGTPENKEPDKCSDLRWKSFQETPVPIVWYIPEILKHIYYGWTTYSEVGWKEKEK